MERISILLTVFGYVIVFFTVFYAKMVNQHAQSIKKKGKFLKLLNYLPFACITPVFIYYIYEYFLYGSFKLFVLPSPVQFKILGFLMLLGSLYLYVDSILVMRENWTIGLELRKKHQVVCKHAFKYIRHPIYSAWLGIILSLVFIFSSPLFIISLIIVFLWYSYRAKIEEFFLMDYLKGYKNYIQKTKGRFIPFVF